MAVYIENKLLWDVTMCMWLGRLVQQRCLSTRLSSITSQKTTILKSFLVCIYKYNKSVGNTTLYLYTKIVHFFRATCFNITRSSSGPPRREIKRFV